MDRPVLNVRLMRFSVNSGRLGRLERFTAIQKQKCLLDVHHDVLLTQQLPTAPHDRDYLFFEKERTTLQQYQY